MTHVCFVLNDLGYFISHRLLIARSLIDLGYTVTVVYGDIGKGNITIPQEY